MHRRRSIMHVLSERRTKFCVKKNVNAARFPNPFDAS